MTPCKCPKTLPLLLLLHVNRTSPRFFARPSLMRLKAKPLHATPVLVHQASTLLLRIVPFAKQHALVPRRLLLLTHAARLLSSQYTRFLYVPPGQSPVCACACVFEKSAPSLLPPPRPPASDRTPSSQQAGIALEREKKVCQQCAHAGSNGSDSLVPMGDAVAPAPALAGADAVLPMAVSGAWVGGWVRR